jgi:hypothetical protein
MYIAYRRGVRTCDVQDVRDVLQSCIKCPIHSDIRDDSEREVVKKWPNRRLRLDSGDLCFATDRSSDSEPAQRVVVSTLKPTCPVIPVIRW